MKKIFLTIGALAMVLGITGLSLKLVSAQSSSSLCRIEVFNATPASVPSGTSSSLSWTTYNCDYTTLSGGSFSSSIHQFTNSAGTPTGALSATTLYTLSAYGAAGTTVSVTSSVSVTVTAPLCTVSSFTATPGSVPVGSASSLSWSTTNCTSISISGGSFSGPGQPASSTGTTTGPLSSATTFTLVASGAGTATVTRTAAVVVTATTVCDSASSGTQDLLHGYAWSSTIGWISLNCAEGGLTGFSDYKIAVNPATGTFSGYAWSPNVGWISFNSADVATQCGPVASLSLSTNQVSGWARVITGSYASGADGCISFNSTGTVAYSVSYNPSSTATITVAGSDLPGHPITGYAWGDTNLGWINFNYATLDSTYAGGTVDIKANGSDGPITMADDTGGPATLSWVSTAVTSCTAVPDTFDAAETYWSGTKAVSGSLSIPVPANTTSATVSHVYGITCTGTSGTVSDTVEIDVPPAEVTATATVEVVGGPLLAFYVDGVTEETVPLGSSVDLSWIVSGLSSCIGTSDSGTMFAYSGWMGDDKTATPDGTYGEMIPSITSNSTFTLICSATDGSTLSRTVIVNIPATGTGGGGGPRPPWKEF